MLVLSRKPGEKIMIDGNIEVTVLSIQGDRVRLGITAPTEVPVDRAEVHKRRAEYVEPRFTKRNVVAAQAPALCGTTYYD